MAEDEVARSEIAAIKAAAEERIRVWEGHLERLSKRIDSLHSGVGSIRGESGILATQVSALDAHVGEAREDMQRFEGALNEFGQKMERGLEHTKEEQAAWIASIGSKFKWGAAFVGPLILGILGLVLK